MPDNDVGPTGPLLEEPDASLVGLDGVIRKSKSVQRPAANDNHEAPEVRNGSLLSVPSQSASPGPDTGRPSPAIAADMMAQAKEQLRLQLERAKRAKQEAEEEMAALYNAAGSTLSPIADASPQVGVPVPKPPGML